MKGVNKGIVPIFAAVLYLLVHFVSDFGGADVMGAQWLYTAVLDLIVLGYILLSAEKYKEAIANVYQHKFTLLYSFFVLWALGSYFYAINPTEALVCLGRLVSTYFIFINLSILFYQQDYKWLFKIIAFFITCILVYDSLFVLSKFSSNLGELNLDQNILSLMGNHGNKNVMAANLLIKIPFCLYIILESKIAGKVIGFIGLTIGLLCLFILNTRSTFVGIGLIFIMYAVFIILQKGIKEVRNVFMSIAFFLIPLIISYFSSNAILSNALKLQDTGGGYGLVSDRLKTINIKDNENSRIHLWKSTADYIIHHPFIGDGYGNWKLASIPYEKELANELFVPYHSHNDFLENTADLGIIGGLAFIGLFILLLFYTIKAWMDTRFNDYKFIIAICFLAITCYGVDALLNFPAERTAMQTMFTMTAALMYIPFFNLTSSSLIIGKSNSQVTNKEKSKGSKNSSISGLQNKRTLNGLIVFVYLISSIILILPSIYIANQTYSSLIIQKYVMGEVNADPKYATDSAKALPNIPNLSTSALPIKALIARYHIRDKNYPEAIQLLNESYNDNPFIHYNDFLLTSIYAALGKYDSTLLYAKRAFYNWPRATSYYKNIMFASVRNKDTLELKKAFDTSVKYYNMPLTWEQYILASYELKSKTIQQLNVLLDTAVKKFPSEDFSKTKAIINSGGVVVPNTTNFAVLGVQSYQKGKYAQAAEYYKKAIEVEPNNYTHYENVAICLYTVQKYEACISYFEKASQFNENHTGKSEFFKAMALISLGKKDQACSSLQAAKVKGYVQADQYIKSNCQ